MKCLILGDGLLGSELIKQTGWEYLSTKKDGIDVVDDFYGLVELIRDIKPDVLINCIGYTNTYDPDREKHWKINYEFVVHLTQYCAWYGIKLVHISTDYIYTNSENDCSENDIPVHQETWYSYCKLLADAFVQLDENDLIIRCSFKPRPFPYEKGFTNVWGNFDYVDVIAKQMIELINENRTGVWNIGTPYKTIYDLAIQTKYDIKKTRSEILPSVEMNINKFLNRNK